MRISAAHLADPAEPGPRVAGLRAAELERWIAEVAPIVHETAGHPAVAFDAIGLPQDARARLRALLID